ncbi:MAG: GNAT family N-acetyltransferase [Acidobacteria bacterium]|nr:GNAT family N-acetyltransferase [Acidobacteriota bacterium]
MSFPKAAPLAKMFQTSPQTEAAGAASLFAAFAPLRVSSAERAMRAEPLARGAEAEVVEFLAQRSVHAVNLLGLIHDNGLVSAHNRGTFYACRDERGRLEGVALVGHATLFEARTPRALRAFVRAAQTRPNLHLVLGESETVAEFWRHYRAAGQPLRLACRELLFQLDRGEYAGRGDAVEGLRLATREDLELIIPVQARMVEEESGLDPRVSDPEGFPMRCGRRVDRGRTWVLVEGGRLVFKAEVMADTQGVVYLEGVHIAPEERGRGRGLRCLSHLTGLLLGRADSVCLLVNERNKAAHAFYRKAGFRFECYYDTIFLRRD